MSAPLFVTPLFVTIVLDGVGIGEQPDAHEYGDQGSDTLGHVCEIARPSLPELTSAGLGSIRPLEGVPVVSAPKASYGKMRERSAGKDSTTGHWELAGLIMSDPFPTYPDGFPQDVVRRFMDLTGNSGVLGNCAASGTTIIADLGEKHLETGEPIVYTSADSVFQIAAHVGRISLEQLYAWCQTARDKVCTNEHAVGRVIARPFDGEPGAFVRLSAKRKDFAVEAPEMLLPDLLQTGGVETISIGKVSDLFAHRGFDRSLKTANNAEGIARLLEILEQPPARPTFVWVNLVDFDQEFGHRNNPTGFAGSLEQFDRALPGILKALPFGARLLLTADHGNDPTTASTDHAREYVPLLQFADEPARDLGVRDSFADHAASVANYFGLDWQREGKAF